MSTTEQFEELKASIGEHGMLSPVVLYSDGGVCVGNARLKASLEIGIAVADIPTLRLNEQSPEDFPPRYYLLDGQIVDRGHHGPNGL